jgi:hypothetical protein
MRFSPLSFLLGISAACLAPLISRNLRPFAVEAGALGLGLLEEVRRLAAQQVENLEDLAAEARARRQELATGVAVGAVVDNDLNGNGTAASDNHRPARKARSPRRSPSSRRTRTAE